VVTAGAPPCTCVSIQERQNNFVVKLSLCVCVAFVQSSVHFPDAGRDRGDVFVSHCRGGRQRTTSAIHSRPGTADSQRVRPLPYASYRQRQSDARYMQQPFLIMVGCASQNVSPSNWQLWRINPSTAPLRPTYSHVSPVLRHNIQMTAVVFYLTLSGRSARSSSLYSRQAGISGFWCHRLERPASPRRICAVTHGFHTTTQDLSPLPFLWVDGSVIDGSTQCGGPFSRISWVELS